MAPIDKNPESPDQIIEEWAIKNNASEKEKRKHGVEFERVGRAILVAFLKALVASGAIDPKGKTHEELLKESKHYLKDFEFTHTIDHTPTILNSARQYAKKGEKEYACLFYSLWIEHHLNGLITQWARRNKCSDECAKILVRETNLKAKYLWLHLILAGRQPLQSHLATIQAIAEARNQFVHYKWPILADDREENEEHLSTALYTKTEATIRHLKRMEATHFYGSRKSFIESFGRLKPAQGANAARSDA